MYHGIYNRLHLHVSASNISVIRAVRKRLHKSHRRGRVGRGSRFTVYRAMIAQHADARRLYERVQRGF